MARSGKTDKMKLLIDNMYDQEREINAHDEDGLSPLHYAARHDHYDMVKLLVENKAGHLSRSINL